MSTTDDDWTKPAALAIPKEGYFELERGRYGPVFPRTPACYGFSIIAKVKEGREDAIREHGKTIQAAITETPEFLAPLRLHYLRWVLFDVGDGLTFQYQGIFDTDFDKYTEDAVQLFGQSGINTVFTNLEGFPEDWKENPDSFVKFFDDVDLSSLRKGYYGASPMSTEILAEMRERLPNLRLWNFYGQTEMAPLASALGPDEQDAHAGFKTPKQVFFVDSMLKNPSGKLLKRDLRERFSLETSIH